MHRTYSILSNLWASGIRDYHNMTSTYLTANSILVAAIIVLLARASTVAPYCVSSAFSLAGIYICVQMRVAQDRFRAQNFYWERNLRIIEDSSDWLGRSLFRELYEFRENQKTLPPEGREPEFKPNFAIRHHRKWWAPRMKGLPWIFAFFYLTLLLWSMLNLASLLGLL